MSPPPDLARLRLCIITDDQPRASDALVRVVAEAVRGGATLVQYREKSASPARVFADLSALAGVCRPAAVPVLVNARILESLEEPVPADGVHVQHDNLGRLPDLLKRLETAGPPLVGYSAHATDEARSAFGQGADFVTLSPVFETPSKAGILRPLGLDGFGAGCRALSPRPVMALGGIGGSSAARVMEAGACGIAVMRGVFSAPDPRAAAAALRRIVDSGAAARPAGRPAGA